MPARLGRQTALVDNEALGRSKGCFGCKIHALCDALGMPIKYILTGGQEAECKQAIPLHENVKASAVLADKAYDTNEVEGLVRISGNKNRHPAKIESKRKN
ncbi:MAG: transposase [Methylobacter sp.]